MKHLRNITRFLCVLLLTAILLLPLSGCVVGGCVTEKALILSSFFGRTRCRDVAQYPDIFSEHTYLHTGYIVFPDTIPPSGIANGAEFFDYAYNGFFDPEAEIVLRCTYDDADFAAEINRLENTVKTSPAGEKPILIDDGSRFSVPAYVAEFDNDNGFEYAVVTGQREITYVYLAFRQLEQVRHIPVTALPADYAECYSKNGTKGFNPEDRYNIYEFLYSDGTRFTSYTDDDWPVNYW